MNDLVLTNEGQRLVNYVKVIDNYFNVLGSLEGSIRLPHQPIEIGVAADTHRYYNTQLVCTLFLSLCLLSLSPLSL